MKAKKYYLHSAISVLLMVLVRFLPPFGAMTPMGMTILGIFAGALYGWITCDMIWPSILALTMLALQSMLPTPRLRLPAPSAIPAFRPFCGCWYSRLC